MTILGGRKEGDMIRKLVHTRHMDNQADFASIPQSTRRTLAE